MFIGHFAVGLASKRLAPRAPLSVLIAAPLLLDLLWPIALLLGVETVRIDPGNTRVTPLDLHDYPFTHSLAMALLWSALAAALWQWRRRDHRAAWVIAAGAFSHWALDFVTHRPDMPLFPGSSTYVGLGLWNSLVGTLLVEVPLFLSGLYVYLSATRARSRAGHIALWSLVGFVAIIYYGNLFGPPPPSATAIAWVTLSMWLFVPWAGWIDRTRSNHSAATATSP